MSAIITYQECPACGSKHIIKSLEVEDFTVSHEIFEVWECVDCTLRFTQNVPDAAGIIPYYKADAYISHTDTNKGLINRLYHIVRNVTMKQKRNLVQSESKLKKGALLDIGAGTGAFVAMMQQSGWQVTGLEPDSVARANAEKLHQLQLETPEKLFSIAPESFDVITMWHVLEHVHNLHGYLDAIQKILKPNGIAMIAVPNYTSDDAEYYGKFWAAWDVPRHLYHFSPASMTTLALAHHMEVKHFIPMVFDSYYVSMLSEKYKTGKNHYLSAFNEGFTSNQKAGRNPKKFSSVIYVFHKKQA